MPSTLFRPIAPRRRLLRLLAIAAAIVAPGWGAAQSLSCGGWLVEVGDARPALVRKCGEPVRVQPVCVPRPSVRGWLVDSSARPTQPIVALECAPAEDWTYDRGPGTFPAIVRLRDAAVESIRDDDKAL